MPRRAYLTIDDSPTRHTDDLTDWLAAENIPAVIFAIGSAYTDLHLQCEGIEQNPDPIRHAIDKDFVIGNHTLTHRRASELSFDEIKHEIEVTEILIDRLYREAGRARPHKLIRFPHLDRGCGGYVVDYDAAETKGYDLRKIFLDGLNVRLVPPTTAQIEKKAQIQNYLAKEGFSAGAFTGITFNWYQKTEMTLARDSLFTFSTADWMLNPDFEAYKKDWPYQTLDALKGKIDRDETLKSTASRHIILAHDHNNMYNTTRDLIRHMKDGGIDFIGV